MNLHEKSAQKAGEEDDEDEKSALKDGVAKKIGKYHLPHLSTSTKRVIGRASSSAPLSHNLQSLITKRISPAQMCSHFSIYTFVHRISSAASPAVPS